MEQISGWEVLALDELGAERASSWSVRELETLLHRFEEQEQLLLITSNLKPEQLRAQLGARVTSRLMGLCQFIEVDGIDFRRLD